VILNGGGTFEVWWVYHHDKHQILNTNASSYSSLGVGEENRHQSSGCPCLRVQIFYLAKNSAFERGN